MHSPTSRLQPVAGNDSLLYYLISAFPNKGRNLLKKILSAGQVSVNGKSITRHDFALNPGDAVTVNWKPAIPKPVFIKMNLEYEDDYLLIVNKMSGLLSIATDRENELTAYRQLRDYVKTFHPGQGLYIVHRLDRDTSGLMMFAKSEKIQEQLQRSWNKAIVARRYVALVEGHMDTPSGTISNYLRESKSFKMHSGMNPSDGDPAITHYRTITAGSRYSLIECELETGRKNQIRVHMADLKHPVAGDSKYGALTNPVGRLALHAANLSFIHPVTGKLMEFNLPVPKKFLHAAGI